MLCQNVKNQKMIFEHYQNSENSEVENHTRSISVIIEQVITFLKRSLKSPEDASKNIFR